MKRRAYIDIETTGLSKYLAELTVIGIAVVQGKKVKFTQLIEDNLTDVKLLRALRGTDEIYSYNGSRFDLPFIKTALGLDLKSQFKHTDLMYDCWKNNLKGGFKVVETLLGIERKLKDIDGRKAVLLWWDYINNSNRTALKTLLEYNKEDVLNLRNLRRKLSVD